MKNKILTECLNYDVQKYLDMDRYNKFKDEAVLTMIDLNEEQLLKFETWLNASYIQGVLQHSLEIQKIVLNNPNSKR